MIGTAEISPFQRVVLAAAARDERSRAAFAFALDNECGGIARRMREPMMAQLRLAWWRDALGRDDPAPEYRSAMSSAIRNHADFAVTRMHLVEVIDGWEELIAGEGDRARALNAFAAERGGGLFAAIAPERTEMVAPWGKLWALWDATGGLLEGDDRQLALRAARDILSALLPSEKSELPRTLRMLAAVAAHDVAQNRGAPRTLTKRMYLRLLRAQFFGR